MDDDLAGPLRPVEVPVRDGHQPKVLQRDRATRAPRCRHPFLRRLIDESDGRGELRRWRRRSLRRVRSEEHTSELQSLMRSSYAVFCLKQKKTIKTHTTKKHMHDIILQ